MRNIEAAIPPELPSKKEARRMLKDAEGPRNSFIDRNIRSGYFQRRLAFGLYREGLVKLATKFAPEVAAKMRYADAKRIVKAADIQDALRTAYDAPVSEPFPIGSYKPNALREINREEADLIAKIPVQIFPEMTDVESLSKKNSSEGMDENIDTVHWSQWYDAYKPENTEDKQELKDPTPLFDEESKKVGRLKRMQFQNQVVSQTNSDLELFIEGESKRIRRGGYKVLQEDLRSVVRYLVETPIGEHSKVLKGALVGINSKSYRIRNVDPGKIPSIDFSDPLTTHLRVIFTQAEGSLVFLSISKHEEMTKKYGARYWG